MLPITSNSAGRLTVYTMVFKAVSFFLLALCRIQAYKSQLIQVSTNSYGCFCLGDVLTYECTVVGGGEASTTLWRGSDFNCSNTDNEIRLRHRIYSSPGGLIQSCNDGAILRRNLRVENDSYGSNYTSQIDLTLTSDLVGGWIECAHDNGLNETVVGTLNISAELCTLSTNVSWTLDCSDTTLFINWNQFVSNSFTTQYFITSANCGSCPTNTSCNNIACTDAPTDGSMCNLTIQAEVHRNATSQFEQYDIKPKLCAGLPDHDVVTDVSEDTNQAKTEIVISVILISLLMLVVLTSLAVLFRKRLLKFISQSGHKSDTIQSSLKLQKTANYDNEMDRSSDVKNDCHDDCRDTVIMKVFDNINNGMYGLEDITGNDQPKFSSQAQHTTEGELDLDVLLMKLQGQISSHWYRFGMALGIPEEFMKQLDDYSEKDALVELLDYWLKNRHSQPTWQEVEVALKRINCTADKSGLLEIQTSTLEFY